MKTILYHTVKTLLLLTFFINLTSGYAQAPEKMSYQAVIRNTSNALLPNQPIGMRVSILQGSETGTEIYKEIYNPNPITNSNGLITVEVGTGVPLKGTFASIDWSNGPYFIKTETDPVGGTNYTITGTSQLMSVPYALYAKSSGNIGWSLSGNSGTNPATNFIGTTDNKDLVFKRNNVISGRIGNNTSFGLSAFGLNTSTGSGNSAFGSFALYSNTSGSDNIAIGANSLIYNTIGERNTSTGVQSMTKNISGNHNTAVGYSSLRNNIEGSRNTAIGYSSLESSLASGNTAVGNLTLHNTTSGADNTAIGDNTLYFNTIGSDNTAIGVGALTTSSSGNNNIGIGKNAAVPNLNGSNQVRIGNKSITYAGIQVAWTITSDQRWKENIESSALGVNFISALRPVSYVRKNDENKKTEYGFIGQELEKTLAEFNVTNSGIITKDDEGMLSVRYNDLLAPMVKAIQELKAENDMLMNRLEKLEQALIKTTE